QRGPVVRTRAGRRAEAGRGLVEAAGEVGVQRLLVEVARSQDVRRHRAALAQQLVDLRALPATHHRHPVQPPPLELGARGAADVLAGADVRAVGFVLALQATGQVYRVA